MAKPRTRGGHEDASTGKSLGGVWPIHMLKFVEYKGIMTTVFGGTTVFCIFYSVLTDSGASESLGNVSKEVDSYVACE